MHNSWPIKMNLSTWESATVEELFYVKGRIGWRGLRRSQFMDHGPYLITGMHISDGKVQWNNCFHISEDKFQESPEIIVEVGDIIITKDGTIGKVAYIDYLPGPTSLNSHLFLVRPKVNRVDRRFAYYIFTSWLFNQHINDHRTGSTISGLSEKLFLRFNLPLPLLQEQRFIADILDTIDTQILYTDRLIAKLNLQKIGLLQDLLSCGLDKYGQLRDPIAHPEQFKESALGIIPKEWEVVQVGQLAERITSGSRGWAIYYSSRGSLFLRISNLTRESVHLRLHDMMFVSPPSNSEGARTAVKPGDVLISITAELGLIGVIPPNFETAYVNQHIALVRFNNSVHPEYIANYLAGETGQKQFRRLNDSGAKAGLNLGAIANLLLPLPSIQEQIAISSAIKSFESIIRVEEEHLFKLKMYKKGLMQDLLSGNIHMNPKGDALSGKGDFCKDIK